MGNLTSDPSPCPLICVLNTGNVQITKSQQTDRFEEIAAELGGQLLPKLMIRRKAKYDWFGKPILKLAPNEHQDFAVPFPDFVKKDLDDLEAKAMANLKADYENGLANWRRSRKDEGGSIAASCVSVPERSNVDDNPYDGQGVWKVRRAAITRFKTDDVTNRSARRGVGIA